MDLKHIEERILKGEQIEEIIEGLRWKEFEELVLRILGRHEFRTWHNFRFKTKRMYEIDVLAVKDTTLLAIDCKDWGRGRYKNSSLRKAALDQSTRAKELRRFLESNPIACVRMKLDASQINIIPLLVTRLEESLIEHENVLVIPIWKFNEFLLNLSNYI